MSAEESDTERAQSPPPTFLFTLRVWREESGDGQSEWCGQVQQVKMFRGMTPDIRKAAQQFFDWIVSYLRGLAEREGDPMRGATQQSGQRRTDRPFDPRPKRPAPRSHAWR